MRPVARARKAARPATVSGGENAGMAGGCQVAPAVASKVKRSSMAMRPSPDRPMSSSMMPRVDQGRVSTISTLIGPWPMPSAPMQTMPRGQAR